MPERSRDLAQLNLKGPVRTARVHYDRNRFTGARDEAWEFDQEGRLLRQYGRSDEGHEWRVDVTYAPDGERRRPGVEVTHGENGSRVELHALSDKDGRTVDGWSMYGLHSVAFPALGAEVARTRFDAQGVPLETVFESSSSEPVASIAYRCDQHGRIREAVQSSGALALPSPASEIARASFTYDDDGRLTNSEVSLLGRQTVTRYAYNDQGDLVETARARDEPTRFEYEYDHRGNWIRKRIHSTGGSDSHTREIAYYDE
jgi:YD repeat-containing protein